VTDRWKLHGRAIPFGMAREFQQLWINGAIPIGAF